jgi:hypothetical protein
MMMVQQSLQIAHDQLYCLAERILDHHVSAGIAGRDPPQLALNVLCAVFAGLSLLSSLVFSLM